MKRIGVLTSGGDAPGMNACIRAVVRAAASFGMEIYGVERGYDGLIDGELNQLGPRDVSDIIQRGGTVLRTARSKAFTTDEGFKMALNMLASYKIEGLIVIGGNGSLSGAVELMKAGIPIIGLPGTIDNDLPFTDYTIGFDTAVNTVLEAISKVRDTSESHERTTIIDVMGRECGDIAAVAGLCGGAEIILVPEHPVDVSDICRTLLEGRNRGKKSSIIVKAEGFHIDTNELENTIRETTGMDTKAVVLGYIQRGGSPTSGDRLLASVLGYRAAEMLRDDNANKAVGVIGGITREIELEEALAMTKESKADLIELNSILAK
jgi:6-phosphofructokinase 1